MKTAIYIRVSTTEQKEHGYSLAAQEERLRAYALSRDLTDIEVYDDGGYSGSNMNRPALTRLLTDVDNDLVATILVYKLDRLSRSQKDTLYIIEERLNPRNTALVSLSESFDTSTPFGRAMVGILSVFAQLERENFKERSQLGMLQRVKSGKWCGFGVSGKVYGYDYHDDELTINEYEAMIVKEVYDLYNRGKGISAIYQLMAKKYPNQLKSTNLVSNILSRELYTGVNVYKGHTYPGNHEAIITPEQFKVARQLAESRNTRRKSEQLYLLTGITYCKCCGYKVMGTRSASTYKGKRYEKYYYKCNTNKRNRMNGSTDKCELRGIKKEEIEQYVIDQIKMIDVDLTTQRMNKQDNPAVINQRVDNIDQQIERLLDLYVDETITKPTLDKKLEQLNLERAALVDVSKIDNTVQLEMLNTLKSFDFERADDEQLQVLIHLLIQKIDVSNDKIVIQYHF